MTKNKDQLQSQLDALRGSINNTREQLADCLKEVDQLQKQLDLEKQTIERWEPSGKDWYINGAGEIYEIIGPATKWREAGATSRTRDQAAIKSQERIARERLQEWVYENGGPGGWTVAQNDLGEWIGLTLVEYYFPGVVRMSKETAERAVKALNNGTLVLEVNDD